LDAERFTRPEELFLSDEFVECARTHALRERLMGGGNIGLDGLPLRIKRKFK
jgi:hypothetical protein